ncbi:MAG: hypothetical protein BGP13_07830 [Sphingobacteriales bacterium 40-81]|nr:MAG: hypothetical protein BGP13_07830 [Sphingobacteriales bacterium 40-81]
MVSAFCVLSVRVTGSVTVVSAGAGDTFVLSAFEPVLLSGTLLQEIVKKPTNKNNIRNFIIKDLD